MVFYHENADSKRCIVLWNKAKSFLGKIVPVKDLRKNVNNVTMSIMQILVNYYGLKNIFMK